MSMNKPPLQEWSSDYFWNSIVQWCTFPARFQIENWPKFSHDLTTHCQWDHHCYACDSFVSRERNKEVLSAGPLSDRYYLTTMKIDIVTRESLVTEQYSSIVLFRECWSKTAANVTIKGHTLQFCVWKWKTNKHLCVMLPSEADTKSVPTIRFAITKLWTVFDCVSVSVDFCLVLALTTPNSPWERLIVILFIAW